MVLTFEDIVNTNLDNFPTSDDFLHSLARMIGREIVIYYKIHGWQKFKEDLIFLLNKRGEVLDYQKVSLYWSKWRNEDKEGYLLISSEINDTAVSHFFYESLDDVIGQIMLTLIENQTLIQDADLQSPVKISKNLMISQYYDEVNFLWDHLNRHRLIMITDRITTWKLYPLEFSKSSCLVMDDNKLVIVGLFNLSYFAYNQPELTETITPFVRYFSHDDAKHILSILIANPGKYQLI